VKLLALILLTIFVQTANAQQAKQANPSLQDTLQWMQNTLPQGAVILTNIDKPERRVSSIADFNGCSVHFVCKTVLLTDSEPNYVQHNYFSLSDIDTEDIQFFSVKVKHAMGVRALFEAHIQNSAEKIRVITPIGEDKSADFVLELDYDYGRRFERAFRHAVALCGGKKSIF
jgi:hypothetical protein